METIVDKRKSFIINFLYFAVIIGLYYFTIKFAFGYIFPFVFATALSVFLQKPINKLKKKLHIESHKAISFILVLLIVVIAVSLIVIAGILIFDELRDFISFLFEQFSSMTDVKNTIEEYLTHKVLKLPVALQDNVMNIIDRLFKSVDGTGEEFDLSVFSAPLSGAWSIVKNMPSAMLSFIVTIISCFFITADYQNIRSLILGFFTEEKRERLISAKHTITYGVGRMFKAYATIMLITFTEMFLGLYLMKVIGLFDGNYIAIISFVTCVVDIVPVLGTGTVLIPWALYNLLFADVKFGIGLLVIYAVITVIRQVIEPKLVANQAGLPAIVTIMAMFVGAKLFGAFGVIILPFTVIIVKFLYDEGIFGNKNNKEHINEDTVEITENSGE